jgi:hypothetical protein
MAKPNVVNLGANSDLAATADVQHVVLDGMDVEVIYSCKTHGRAPGERHVSQFAISQFLGWTTPESVETTFDSLHAACSWLGAGKPYARDAYGDEVDYRAAEGAREGRFRLGEMLTAGVYDPYEFATCMLLFSHGALDWGWHVEDDSLHARLEFWDDNVSERTEDWPHVTSAEVAASRAVYAAMARVLDERFRDEAYDAGSREFWAAVEGSAA